MHVQHAVAHALGIYRFPFGAWVIGVRKQQIFTAFQKTFRRFIVGGVG